MALLSQSPTSADALWQALSPQAQSRSQRAIAHLADHFKRHNEAAPVWMPFDVYMDFALNHPQFGYYTAGEVPFGAWPVNSDFITAPESTPLFGQTLALQVAEILARTASSTILEIGPGSGRLAYDLLTALQAQGISQVRYQLLETSPRLRAQQACLLAPYLERVQWLNQLPEAPISGCVIANELLDALPVKRFVRTAQGEFAELGVVWRDAQLAWATRATMAPWVHLAQARLHAAGVPEGIEYVSEIGIAAEAWVSTLSARLDNGVALLIDYGFPGAEFYHPQRSMGTLMCHVRHHAHDNPLFAPGAQDITAHIDFSAMAQAACQSGARVLGYLNQGRFLINAGLMETYATRRADPQLSGVEQHGLDNAVQRLTSEAEMGELFKVLAITRLVKASDGDILECCGFHYRDRTASL